MLTTLTSVFPHISSGGYILIEDMVNSYLLNTFFQPAATYLAQQAEQGFIETIHLYPMVLVVHKCCSQPGQAFAKSLSAAKKKVQVSTFHDMWTAINTVEPGTDVILKNAAWGSLFQEHGIFSIFSNFIDLHQGTFADNPPGCKTTANPVCTNSIAPLNHVQSRVAGVHIYPDSTIIEVAEKPPYIAATRKGTEWMSY